MRLYTKKNPELTKLAGTPVSGNPKTWPGEVLKSLVGEHPYIDTSQVKVEFTHLDPDSDLAAGRVILSNKIVVPITIRKNSMRNRWEIDPLDVLYDGQNFKHLNENSLRKAIDEKQVGTMLKDPKKLPKGDKYVGDITGDVTPLEWSGYPAYSAGARSISAGSGLLSYVIKNQEAVTRLFNLLGTYDGVNSAAEAVGLRDSLEALDSGLAEQIPNRNRMAHIMRNKHGGFAVVFDNGDTRTVSTKDLKLHMGDDFHAIMRRVMQRGWAVVRNYPVVKSMDVSMPQHTPAPIEIGGMHRVYDLSGKPMLGLVCTEIVDFDGSVIKEQKFLMQNGCYATGKAMVGHKVPELEDYETIKYDYEKLKYVKKLQSMDAYFPIGDISVGAVGCFIDESFGSPKATPHLKIMQIFDMPGQPRSLICKRLDTGGTVGIILLEAIVRPQEVLPGYPTMDVMPKGKTYYLPAHMSFVNCDHKIAVVDKQSTQELNKDIRPKAMLVKSARRYSLFGDTTVGEVRFENMDETQMRTKLAWYGASDQLIEKAINMKSGQTQELYGMRPAKVHLKVAKRNLDFSRLKMAAGEAIEGMDQAAQQDPSQMQDPKMLDSILSLQFVSDESLGELIEADPIFEECEDKLARLLLAARQGETSIHEKGIQRALKGMGEARSSLKELEIALQHRET